jgi:hypothetical protein
MRCWSHHHSTDTVDDPVFRAAMRGCDVVSFVFGLEVTWSLIQQRKQEEEERRALEELLKADNRAEKTKIKVDVHGYGHQASLSESDDDSSDNVKQSDDDQNYSSQIADGIDENQENPLNDTDEAVAIARKPISEVSSNHALEFEDSSHDKDYVLSERGNQLDVTHQSGVTEWACPICTLHNKKYRRKCTACGTRRPSNNDNSSRRLSAGSKRSFDELSK